VGDQSSGKSSVLEGLTGLPFPRDSGLCTRFPTQIVFKRSKIQTTEASIMAAHGQDGSKVDAIAKFGKKQLKALDQKTFSNILAEVSALKGTLCQAKTSRALVHRHRNVWAFHCQGIIVKLIWSRSPITS
jgi:hypothetical protein